MMRMLRYSLAGKLAAALCGVVFVVVGISAVVHHAVSEIWVAFIVALALGVVLACIAANVLMRPVRRQLLALRDGVAGLKDGDFSTGIASRRRDEVGEVVAVYNDLGDVLRRERQSLFQRELLLDTVIQSTPLALVLVNRNDRVIYSNSSARHLFHDGRPLNGHDFNDILKAEDPGYGNAVSAQRDGLFTVDEGDEPQTFHLSCRRFELNGQSHWLYLFKRLTHELSRQEVATWKKVIRVISHELNNSLAPISSLAHSGGLVLERQDLTRLSGIFETIEERARHLKAFIEGYARFARLPAPRLASIDAASFLTRLGTTVEFTLRPPDLSGSFTADVAQFEQVLINLLKNAHESGSTPKDIVLEVTRTAQTWQFDVLDRGSGMSDKVLKSALLPFYSTKQSGTGLGLPLCREIVEAHGGRLSMNNRRQGGLKVRVALPAEAQ
ncbi:MAG: ATP-binding protein [Pseudomonadota bacterium]